MENLNLKETCQSLHVCFDNDIAGKQACNKLQHLEFKNIPFQNDLPKEFKDWNEVLQNK
ncbi:toprim domain-containing protein [Lactococcus lactis]